VSRGRLHHTVCRHAGQLVYVREHTLLDDTYGRLSNWVTFSRVRDDGTVERATAGAYDYNDFEPVVKRVEIVVRDWDGIGDPD